MGVRAENNNRITQEITFEQIGNDASFIKVCQNGWKNIVQESIDESFSSCMGLTQMLCSLKVYLEYGKTSENFFTNS